MDLHFEMNYAKHVRICSKASSNLRFISASPPNIKSKEKFTLHKQSTRFSQISFNC